MEVLLELLLLAAPYLLLRRRWRSLPGDARILRKLTYFYLCLVLAVTVHPFPFFDWSLRSNALATVNLEPFRDVLRHYRHARVQVLLNLLMTVPFGLLLPLCTRQKLGGVLGLSFLFSLTIESLQLLSAFLGAPVIRRFDVTDILANVCGALLGYLLYRLCLPLIRKILKPLLRKKM